MQENVLILLEWYNYITQFYQYDQYISASLISALYELLRTNSKSHRRTIT